MGIHKDKWRRMCWKWAPPYSISAVGVGNIGMLDLPAIAGEQERQTIAD